METLSLIGNAFAGMMNPMSILLLIVGVAVGIVFGSIPGLSAAMAVALFLPVTFAMQAHEAFTLLVALYIGGISGGLVSAILINIPGTSSIATCFDGSPMAKKGEAGKALGTGVVFSFLGGLFSFLVLMFVAPSVAQITLKFSAIEYFGVCLFALSMIAALAGTSMIKGLLSGCLGLIIALVGMAPIDGTKRFTFGINELSSGFDILPTLIGIFAIAEVLAYAEEVKKMGKATQVKQSFKIKGFGFTWKEFVGQKWNALRSALIGTGIGILPGIGGSTAGILSWMTAKKTSKHPEKYGTGIMDGVVASETSNNAVIGGALIPLLTLGIPGDTNTAVLLGALTMQGIAAGPQLFTQHGEWVYTIMLGLIAVNIFMYLQGRVFIRGFVNITRVPTSTLVPILVMLCVIGAYAIDYSVFNAIFMVGVGIFGYFMTKLDMPMTPMVIGLVLGKLCESNLRRALIVSKGSWATFFTSPISLFFILLSLFMLFFPYIKKKLAARRAAA